MRTRPSLGRVRSRGTRPYQKPGLARPSAVARVLQLGFDERPVSPVWMSAKTIARLSDSLNDRALQFAHVEEIERGPRADPFFRTDAAPTQRGDFSHRAVGTLSPRSSCTKCPRRFRRILPPARRAAAVAESESIPPTPELFIASNRNARFFPVCSGVS